MPKVMQRDMDIEYSIATEIDREELAEFITLNFMRDEPMNEALGVGDNPDTQKYAADDLERSLAYPVSIIARDKNNGNKIVGARTTTILGPADWLANGETVHTQDIGDEQMDKILAFLRLLEQGFQTADPPITCTRIAHFEMLSVAPPYRRRGIAMTMVKKSMDALKKEGCNGVYGTGTALASQIMFDKLGFRPLKYIDFVDYKHKNGEQIIKPTDGTMGGFLYYKDL